jgi:hypothetical protein
MSLWISGMTLAIPATEIAGITDVPMPDNIASVMADVEIPRPDAER